MNIRVFMLGTGAAIPISRGLPCIAVKADSNIYLLDIGEGCQSRLFKAGLSPLKIKAVFITHVHGDHYLGLFGLIQTMHLSNRKDPLKIMAPKEIFTLIEKYRELHLLNIGFQLSFIDITEGVEYTDDKITVTPYPVSHTIPAYGFLLKAGKTVISYSGDTGPASTTIEYSKNADILIHEATFTSEMREEAHEQGHSTSGDAAMIASRAGVKLLVLTHISARYSDDNELYVDAYRFFRNVVVAKDYMILLS
ncbi:MAG: ribonuclease Z [Thermosphaera sp.]